ncbi:MAG TPA: hypothetical protein VLH85_06330 [Levilinea sp.]|nr:hypothetical protein [Levilinea sp.]
MIAFVGKAAVERAIRVLETAHDDAWRAGDEGEYCKYLTMSTFFTNTVDKRF